MALSLRLKTIAALVPDGASVCDVGTDHGRLPIYLISENKAKSVIATDIRPLPLNNAKKNIALSGLDGIEARLCDGLSAVSKDEVDTVIIAGIGGEVISGIISRAEWLKGSDKLLILQPTTSPEALRRYLSLNGFEIITDTALKDNGKLYSVMTVCFSGKIEEKREYYYYIGKVNPDTPDGLAYIKKQYNRIKTAADAIKDIPGKQKDYSLYRQITDDIMILTEKNNGI